MKQIEEIDDLNNSQDNFKIYKGSEVDILPDGTLDFDNEILKELDYVVASVHSVLKMDQEAAEKRLLRAIENPYVTILGHMTGRLLLMREGYPISHKKIIDACVANKVVIELNANPRRLDIDWRHLYYAMEKNALISINPDAHEIGGIDDMKYGVYVARKAGVPVENVLNTFARPSIEKIFAEKH
jgi:DNA polymerase (family 10)